MPKYEPTPADKKLDMVYGDHVHQNNGSHLSGGVDDNAAWQACWTQLCGVSHRHYSVLSGQIGRMFIWGLASKICGAYERHWNWERPLAFAAVVLTKTSGIFGSSNIRQRIKQRITKFWFCNIDSRLNCRLYKSFLISSQKMGRKV